MWSTTTSSFYNTSSLRKMLEKLSQMKSLHAPKASIDQQKEADGHRHVFDLKDWSFLAEKHGAIGTKEREEISKELQLGALIPLPEMFFHRSFLQILHTKTNFELSFYAQDALRLWAQEHVKERGEWVYTSFDFTYCSRYHGTLLNQIKKCEETKEKLPLEKLMQQVEILYYDHVILYEDDVRDLGEVYLEVKIRVMSFGFLILCRYYARIDDKNIRIHDTRYYHEFDETFLWRDYEEREANLIDLQKDLYPTHHMTEEAHVFDYSADTVYPLLTPKISYTEKIYF